MLLQHGTRYFSSIRCCHAARQAAVACAPPHSSHHIGSGVRWCSKQTHCRVAAVDNRPEQQTEASSLAADDHIAANSSSSIDEQQEQEQQDSLPEMRLQLPPPTNSQVKTAEFVKSSVAVADCPPPKLPEFAVIGRSNVGKSSLINLLTNRKSLAMVSKQPGKTRCINHFIINGSWYLVDLPGYGYARTGKDARRGFEQFTRQYFQQRATLAMVLLLVDCSIPPQDADLEYAAWLGQQGLPFSIVFTKADKRKKGQPRHSTNVVAFKQALVAKQGFAVVPPCLVTSASQGLGKQEVLNFIASLRVLFEQQQQKQKKPPRLPNQVEQEEQEQTAGSSSRD